MTEQLSMGTHPDIVTLHARYETASETAAGQLVGGTTFLAGLYLAISPWVVGFDGQQPVLFNNLIIGSAAALLGLGLTAAFDRLHRLAWTVPVLGVWTIVSPWVIQTGDLRTTDNEWNNVVTGAVLLLVGIGSLAMAMGRSANPMMGDSARRRAAGRT
ncbi:MAG: repeat protein [Frankiales bacterium]|nr:repeat protein [Frankiales bacterium]